MHFIFTHTDSLVPGVRLEDILIFVTGASAWGWSPVRKFIPFASSCANVLSLPPIQGENVLCFVWLSWVWLRLNFVHVSVSQSVVSHTYTPMICTLKLTAEPLV